MAENWETFGVQAVFPDEIRGIVEAVTTITGALNEVLTITKTALEIVKALASQAASNPVELILRQTINEIESFIDALTQQTTANAIIIPIQKQPFGLGERRSTTDIDDFDSPIDQLIDDGSFSVGPSLDTIEFINETASSVGGNAGFWRALQLSLQDPGDRNKPDFPLEFAVAGVCIIFGAEDYQDLQKNFALFERVFAMGNRASFDGNTRPVAQNVRTRALPVNGATPARIGIQIDWDTIPPILGFPLYSDQVIVVNEIFIVRSTNSRFREQFSWNQSFSREPQDSSSDLQEEGDNKVIARVTNDGFILRHIDDEETLVEGEVYYYGLALRYSIEDEVQPMGNFSNVVRTRFSRPTGTRRSVAPDWWGTPSLIALFPDLEGLINTIRLEIAGLGSRTVSNSGASAVIEQTIAQIDLLLEQGEALLAAIDDTAGKLIALTELELVAATSSTVFGVSSGGMNRWMGDLAARMNDQSDPTRPPFDQSELVAGIVIVAGAPNLPDLQPFLDLLGLFFGSADDNPILNALNTIEVAARDAETLTFGPGMAPSRDPDPIATTPPQTLFDPNMNPTSTIACD